ncbi:MAG: peptidase U32 family protein, partial [Clostridia bacterium]
MKMKILSPAGDMDSLRAAVYNGADEVYLGVKDFNARNIEGFSLATLEESVRFAHIFGVRVFLAVNILFSDDEMQSAVDLIVDAYNMGVDAFIIQDLGLASIIHANYPMVEMHASTQMGIHNLEGVKVAQRLGFKRVVLSRETALSEIRRIRENSDVEIEYFAHGALCVSFSGNCYLSSYMFDASGNRGKCKQLCRLPYSFMLDDEKIKEGYLLSAKDFCLIDRLQDLEEAGVTSLKIEGRARRPYYVAVATREYRKALEGKNTNKEELKLAFNRGYTEGYFNGNGGIISNKQNHIGIKIGEVVDFRSGKKFNEIFISSDREISPKSVLKFFHEGEEMTTISAFDIKEIKGGYKITTTQVVDIGYTVNLISHYDREQSVLSVKRKVPINILIKAKANEEICATFTIQEQEYRVLGEKCLESKSSPITHDEIVN